MSNLSDIQKRIANLLKRLGRTKTPSDSLPTEVQDNVSEATEHVLREKNVPITTFPHEDVKGNRSGLQNRPRRQQQPVVIVGCDFGTHSTKVLFQRRGESRLRLVTIGEQCEGYPACATPSLVLISGDRLLFGSQAARAGGKPFASLKVDLLRTAVDPPTGNHHSAEILVAAYLSWILSHVRARVQSEYANASFIVQLAAPIDYRGYVQQSEIKQRFQRVTQAAWSVAFGGCSNGVDWLQDSVSYSAACDTLQRLLQAPLQDESEARYQVLPETVAPIVSLALDPEMQRGIYLMVDTGAGTTEMSVVHSTEFGDGEVATCYFDSTIEVGGDKLQQAAQSRVEKVACDLVSQLEKQARKVHFSGLQKVSNNRNARRTWDDLTIVLTGGGTQRSDVAAIFRAPEQTPLASYFHQYQIRTAVLDGPRINLDTDDLGVPGYEARYLVVARGLLVEQALWPVTFLPEQVEHLERAQVIAKPQPHWEDR